MQKPILIASEASITNDAGGTTSLPTGRYRFEVTRAWEDHECGIRLVGTLLDAEAIAVAKAAGVTGYAKEGDPFDPATVYVSEFDCLGGKQAVDLAVREWERFQEAEG